MKREFSRLQSAQPFDLLVCGGGIYGAWTAYDAALRGLKVALVEQGDWAAATSSASSKLIHGGLRYLESYDFKLVKKALRERQMLLRVAPHRVWPLRFGVPLYAGSRMGRWTLKLGLMLYDFLAASIFSNMAHRYFNRSKFAGRFAALKAQQLNGGFTYSDAQTDDARLVLELVDGAMRAGAVCVNYCKLLNIIGQSGHAHGAVVQDMLLGQQIEIQAKQLVMATGQWSAVNTESAKWCRVTKGVHLVMPPVLLDEALLLTAPVDGRVFFMIPWYGHTLVGTTDNDYSGDMNNVQVADGDVEYLLDACNAYLKMPWLKADVIASFAGLRVMKRSDRSAPSAVSRDWELKSLPNGVHYSIGGKITSAREDAARIVDRVCAELQVKQPCTTFNHAFPWMPGMDYTAWVAKFNQRGERIGIDAECMQWLLRRHGRHAEEIIASMETNPQDAKRIVTSVPLLWADLLYCAQHEMAVHLLDLLRRRMPLLILARLDEKTLYQLAQRLAPLMGWDQAAIAAEVAQCLP